jgi:succinyl-CoA synthetase alpha subunit
MAIFLTEGSKVLVQGITGAEGGKHTRRMLASGTNIVAGVTPGKGGQSVDADGREIPVFGSVGDAVAATGADVSVVFVPPRFTKGSTTPRTSSLTPRARAPRGSSGRTAPG